MPKATRELKKKEGVNWLTKKSGDNGKCDWEVNFFNGEGQPGD